MYEEKYVLQAEVMRRQIEAEVNADSDKTLTYIFQVKDDTSIDDVKRFVDTFSNWGYDVVVYYENFEIVDEDRLRKQIKKLAPEVGLRVEEE